MPIIRNHIIRFLTFREVNLTQDTKQKRSEIHTLRAFREATRELDNLYSVFPKFCGLSEPEYWSLLLICEGVTSQSQISEQLFLSRQTLNSAFKQLIRKGLITLTSCEDNQRMKRAALTPEGYELVEKQLVRMHGIEEEAWKKLDREEQETLDRLIRKYADVLKETLAPYTSTLKFLKDQKK